MSNFNFSTKLLKEVFRGMGANQLIAQQKEAAKQEVEQANMLLEKLQTDFNERCEDIMRSDPSSVDEFKAHLRTLNFENLDRNLEKLIELRQEKEDYLLSIDELHNAVNYIKQPVFGNDEYSPFWVDSNFQVYSEHHLDIRGLESSKVDFHAVSKNKKVAYFILVELNRNAPESNVLKLYYYLKNSKTFWDFEDIVILQIFSPKYLVEKRGKSLALAREMAIFLGNEFSGHHSFGEQKVRMHYSELVFAEHQYEIYSVFWKLMADESDEEVRYELMCKNLPGNKNFLSLCRKLIDKQQARNMEIPQAYLNLANNIGTSRDIQDIFRSWCSEVILFIEDNFNRFSYSQGS